ncbi:MAG: hypothetical protein FRX49_03208 [Trebouxia sp. A1-2]|nr:MAG: hypothetical protein FRX49_03208 [Trebouxia sp. A1-2]
MYGVQLSPELGSLRGVVPKLSLEMGNLLLSYCQLAAQAGLAPLKALHTLPTTQTVFFQTPANHQAELPLSRGSDGAFQHVVEPQTW